MPWQSIEASRDMPEHAWEQLAVATARLDELGLAWQAWAVMGEPAESIVREAQTLGASAIVIGSHGRSGIKAMVMGSVALEVLHLAKVSVWVVRGPQGA